MIEKPIASATGPSANSTGVSTTVGPFGPAKTNKIIKKLYYICFMFSGPERGLRQFIL